MYEVKKALPVPGSETLYFPLGTFDAEQDDFNCCSFNFSAASLRDLAGMLDELATDWAVDEN